MEFKEPKGLWQREQIRWLYSRSFPKAERKPFFLIEKMRKKGKTDIWYFSDEKGFLGFAATINGEDLILIDYFAVSPGRRGQGHGTKMLRSLLEYYSPRGVFLEIEVPYEDAANYDQRIKRRNFYIRAGLTPMHTRAKLFGVDMELLGLNCALDYEAYRNFYLHNYGEYAYRHIGEAE